jgi:hypothetical protein
MTARIFEWVYQHLLLVFPPGFRAEYQEEMQAVFAELLAAHSRNVWSLLAVGLRELFQAPLALFRTYRLYWRKHLPDQLNPLEGISPESGPGASGMLPDGRSDWLQALLEISLFAALGAGLVFMTYLPPLLSAGWERSLSYTAYLFALLPILIFLAGIYRGLPRWAFPSAGLISGFLLLGAALFNLLPVLAGIALVVALLIAAAGFVHVYVRPLPIRLWNIWHSFSQDGSRLSFAVYGMAPLLITIAFDDAHYNNRTPWYAVAVLAMILGALGYSRSHSLLRQMFCLLGGMAAVFCAALLDQAYFHQGFFNWLAEPGTWLLQVSWLLKLGANVLIILLLASLPAWLKTLSQSRQAA